MKRKNKAKDKKIIVRVAGLLLGSILVSAALLINLDTFSWFSSNVTSQISVTAATTEDIIKDIEIVKENKSAKAIKFKKTEGLSYNPVIFFSIDGEASDYILHINSVELDEQGEYIVPIEPNINTSQYLKLFLVPIWRWSDNPIEGTIQVKHLNNFISEEYKIELSRKYLSERFWEEIKRQDVDFKNVENIDEVRREVTDIITYIAKHVSWEDEKLREDGKYRMNAMTAANSMITPISRLFLTPEQNEIIDVIAPKLRPHLDGLYAIIEELSYQLNEKLAEIEQLNLQLQDQNAQIQTLQDGKIMLEGKINDMTLQNEELKQYNTKLNEDIVLLEDIVASLEEKNKKLDRQNDSLSDGISSLSSENSKLREENIELRQQIEQLQKTIDELMTIDDGDTTVPEDVYGD